MIKYVIVICIGVAYVIASRASAADAANCRTFSFAIWDSGKMISPQLTSPIT